MKNNAKTATPEVFTSTFGGKPRTPIFPIVERLCLANMSAAHGVDIAQTTARIFSEAYSDILEQLARTTDSLGEEIAIAILKEALAFVTSSIEQQARAVNGDQIVGFAFSKIENLEFILLELGCAPRSSSS